MDKLIMERGMSSLVNSLGVVDADKKVFAYSDINAYACSLC